jgi:hypothetical protein
MNRIAFAVMGLAAVAIAIDAQAVDLVVPQSLANVDGNVNNYHPFGEPVGVARYQQVYGASEFAAFNSPITILGLAFRPDGVFGAPLSALHSHVDIRLSTTSKLPDGLSATFSENIGVDETTVYSGPLPLTTNAIGPPGGPYAFDFFIPLTTPFVYDPAGGSLLFDMLTAGLTSPNSIFVVDAHDDPNDAISRVWGAGLVGDIDPLSGTTIGVVTKFIIVPEPATLLLVAIGCAAAATAYRPPLAPLVLAARLA